MDNKFKIFLRFALFGIIGAALGYTYYYFWGCQSGTCPLKSNWKITTLYGFVSGLIIGIPTKKKK